MKRLMTFILALVLILSLAGCGKGNSPVVNNEQDSTSTQSTASDAPSVLNFANLGIQIKLKGTWLDLKDNIITLPAEGGSVQGVMVFFSNDEAQANAKTLTDNKADKADIDDAIWHNNKRLYAIAFANTKDVSVDEVAEQVGGPDKEATVTKLEEQGDIGLIILISIYKTVCVFLPPKIMDSFGFDLFDRLFLFSGYIGFFLLGYFIHMTQRHFSNHGLLIVAVADYALIVFDTWRQSAQAGIYTSRIQDQNLFFMGLLAVCIFLLCKQNYIRLKSKKGEFIIRWLSSLSYGVYLLHGLILTLLPLYGINLCFWQDALIGLAITTIVCIVSIFILSSIRPLCFVCIGIPYKTACQSSNIKALIYLSKAGSNEHRIKARIV